MKKKWKNLQQSLNQLVIRRILFIEQARVQRARISAQSDIYLTIEFMPGLPQEHHYKSALNTRIREAKRKKFRAKIRGGRERDQPVLEAE